MTACGLHVATRVCVSRCAPAQPCVTAPRTTRSIPPVTEAAMSKRARKRRSRKGNKANHGRKPNA
jgi:hypothetical protein